MRLPEGIDPGRHVIIAGPTASGKSALAMAIARAQGGTIVNADALQVWSCWHVLTARPSDADESDLPHRLYGHVARGRSYSVGDWLAEVAALRGRLIIVGGTGLYLTALTSGLAVIPPTPPEIRAEGDRLLEQDGLQHMIASLDAASRDAIDLRNPVRVQRAWEVLRATGRSIIDWRAETPAPLINPDAACLLSLVSDRDWLADRIEHRFDLMLAGGALNEVQALLPDWDARAQWAKAIGAPELISYLQGELSLDEARMRAIFATRQYAKSQRIWFRNRMRHWRKVAIEELH